MQKMQVVYTRSPLGTWWSSGGDPGEAVSADGEHEAALEDDVAGFLPLIVDLGEAPGVDQVEREVERIRQSHLEPSPEGESEVG